MVQRISAILSLDVVGYGARMTSDPAGTLDDLQRVLRAVVRPAVRGGDGRIVKLLGDGALVEFPSAGDAIRAAAQILAATRQGATRLRAGVHVGDVAVEGDDIFGDAVIIAARLQAAAPPGGGLVSRFAAEMAGGALEVALRPEGALNLKGAARPIEALSIDLGSKSRAASMAGFEASQKIRFATSRDGVRLAWTGIGAGPVLIKAPNWISHLTRDWDSFFGGWLASLAHGRRLIRFDQRGNGLSDRGVAELSLDRFVDDLEAVFDAAGVARAPVIGLSQGATIAAAFAARYPERVSGLICVGGFAQGVYVRADARHAALVAAQDAMSRAGWDDAYPSIRDHFARLISPDATMEDQRVFAERMRDAITAEEFGRFREAVGRLDVADRLASVACPALVLHATGDRTHPIEQGRRLASGMPDARFVALNSRNHLMPDYDSAWPIALREIDSFLSALA
ncbi:alpha/beta fold hydrolase [Pikeienuella sp. HZG-20]|uniref:alpha/beta fold hydrolase n=1 Tax=Paludibacillus litoralis TaxID=3133267 RepID=UPI0030ED9702